MSEVRIPEGEEKEELGYAKRAISMTDGQMLSCPDGRSKIFLSFSDCLRQWESVGQEGGDGRRECAAGPMQILRLYSSIGEGMNRAVKHHQPIGHFITLSMSSLHKETVVKIKNVDLNGGRSGAFGCLKRMGANIETVSRREKFGDVYGDLEIRPLAAGKRLQGRRFSEDTIATGLEEYAFLAVAACFAEGETILRVPKEVRVEMRPISDFFAESLRKTGAEVGVYDDGLVIRGLETVVNGSDFDGGKWPQMGLALSVLSIALGNEETVVHSEVVEETFPGVVEKLRKVLVPEEAKGE